MPKGDVHVRDGVIVAVAQNIEAPDAQIIDATKMVVMPGFVETHWHMWNGIWRGIVDDATAYFRTHMLLHHYTAEDHYAAVRFAALDAINAGITTCNNWAHGVRHSEDAEAEMQALVDSGIRAKFCYPCVVGGHATNIDDLKNARDWAEAHGNGLLGLGALLDETGAHIEEHVAMARELGLRPITNHGGFLATPDLIGPEFIFTHGPGIQPHAIELIKAKGVKVAFCPCTDPLIGNGLPPVYAMSCAEVPLDNLSFSVDVTGQTSADPFAALRMLVDSGRMQQVEAGNLTGSLLAIAQAGIKWKFGYKDALRVGTLGGANVLGLADQIGSLTPGKRADIILVRTDEINMMPARNIDPTCLMLQNAKPNNVDTVIIDGHIRKRYGQLIGVDIDAVVSSAAATLHQLRVRAATASCA
ncbi:amidohydrolase family protein [Allorhizobium sp. BGMRC 0089]|uniref:amidohydrolase family protein n=1 Tax=Allorhizobium sonneratiae TaxID=2934936 RepID=UPI0020349A13|nr:amidohydrolase family protein [Allorhizobium sonneratiae]MCM2293795.1 amidohydrolase family protein [Allorhizobium sonneratiae]